jgi:hypothetical protein
LVEFGLQILQNHNILGISNYYDLGRVVTLINEERFRYGLAPLQVNHKLNSAALAKGENMLYEDYWAHDSISGKRPWDFIRAAGYYYGIAGENLARDFATEEAMVAAWMASPTHRANILNPRFQELGLATVEGQLSGQDTVVVVNMFGSPARINHDASAIADPSTSTSLPLPPATTGATQRITDDTVIITDLSTSPEATQDAALFASGIVLSDNSRPLVSNLQISQALYAVATLVVLGVLTYKIFFPRRKLLK